ncbi:MAG TPA: hypothetical protein DEB06_09710 [Phycisphaerales bacterium]|nr:hypothetical protein [Phycisphaerales bacterium]
MRAIAWTWAVVVGCAAPLTRGQPATNPPEVERGIPVVIADPENPDRYDITVDPFPGRPITPVAEAITLGSGPIPMILIPSVGCDWTVWRGFMERNAARYSMAAVTLPGFGGSEPPPWHEEDDLGDLPYMRNAAKALLALIDESGMHRPVLVGHGMGGMLAAWAAAKNPDKVRAAISIDGAPIYITTIDELDNDRGLRREHVTKGLTQGLKDDSPQDWEDRLQMMAQDGVTDPVRVEQVRRMYMTTLRGTLIQSTMEYMMADLRVPLMTMQVPTLFVGVLPPDPQYRPLAVRQRWSDVLGRPANTIFVLLENTRHFVMDDQPEQLDALVQKFILGQPIDNAMVSIDGTAKPLNPELQTEPAGAPPQP